MSQLPVALESFHAASEAIRKLESLNGDFPELIICDLELGSMSGVDFLKWLRASPVAVIPVVIRSNSRLQQHVDEAYTHGANCYLQKGFDLEAVERNFKLLLHFWSNMCMPEVRHEALR